MKTSNELHDLWVAQGDKVENLNEKLNVAMLDDSVTAEELQKIKNERDTAKMKRDMFKEQYTEARANEIVNMSEEDKKPLTENEEEVKANFVKDFKNLVRGRYQNLLDSKTDHSGSDAGLTIPQDIRTAINTLVRQYDSLQEYVNVENVTTLTGSRVYEKWTDITGLANIDDEAGKIADIDDPKLSLIKYTIKRYAGISTVTNSLLADSAENILAWLSGWIAKKVVVTRNKAILGVVDKLPTKPTLTKWDDIIDLEAKVDPAIKQTSFFLTNTSGFTALKKVKNALGDYLMERDVKSPTGYSINGFAVKEISDRWLPNASSGVMPLYFGDLKQAVTLFDRQQMSLLSTNIGGGAFETDTTKVRVIDRFDVVATDTEAFVPASFKAIADQKGNIGSTAV
ncbi:major head protein [Streptococcus phage CHPC930]|uniref:Major capsid protein n=5 Tax=Moineauvirus TaxID=1623304 RepID=A0A286QT84_9CAUD|nr:major head protein [Streptococcus phage CHPC1045]YP_010645369.1 major head protein [Streptococcus phage CHPC1046]YP_010646223.1 major head protein [Streptococcus phage CHPC930]YP_010646865.1 major head protein [Streptococcus phage P7132]YP_010647614.1 major head protein [Streptococcus phage P9902]AZF91234.1 capsid protein [Streptococcus phage CHPC1014]AZF91622.1 capsid protein [Streptococcus phage CHPC1048]ARU13493.1 major capsid protein [Streptococcus phage P7132]ARU14746.1 major capsid